MLTNLSLVGAVGAVFAYVASGRFWPCLFLQYDSFFFLFFIERHFKVSAL